MRYLPFITDAYVMVGNPSNAAAMKAYMRDQFEFLGIKSPERRAITKGLKAEYGLPAIVEMPALIKALWKKPEREYQYAAIDIMQLLHKEWRAEDITLFEFMILHKSWWDTVDSIVSCLVGPWFKKFPEHRLSITNRWINSDNMWLQRVAIIHQNSYKKHTDEQLLFRYIKQCAQSKEFFIQKAIGWALREYSKTNPNSVRRFVETNTLAALSTREALRRID
ncbi:DNA alkylation repair protein [Chitinophaga arvensicola]|uniref:3-methyladenine DNA glycosylase AlkD n=1 Tax=Chitinophaga arvensicola TaxID=29529 RepID=A0A1I0PVJ5_9BACT|nr:DNA alkylation repair protein [Chitinophaga arvensicola]SEW18513.1 3-methyladenine DNA glycosylase AlkD [Chitinophaga arvensicola]